CCCLRGGICRREYPLSREPPYPLSRLRERVRVRGAFALELLALCFQLRRAKSKAPLICPSGTFSRKREKGAAAGEGSIVLLFDQELFHLAPLGGQGGEPAGLAAAAGPGFLGVVRVAVLGRDLAQLAGLLGDAAGAARGGGAGGAEQLLDRLALGLGLLLQLATHLGDRLALGQGGLALLGLVDEGLELSRGQGVDIDRHMGSVGNNPATAAAPAMLMGCRRRSKWERRDRGGKCKTRPGFTPGGAAARCRVWPYTPSRANTAARSRFSDSAALRWRYSNVPASRPRPDTTTRCGMPTSSISANIEPGRRPRSSSTTSTPADCSSRYSEA